MKEVAGYAVSLDSTVARSGRRSLRIASVVAAPEGFQGVSQSCTVGLTKPTRLRLVATVKTSKNAAVALWCQIWDDTRMIGFANSEQQDNVSDSTGNWHDLSLNLLVTPATKRFVFGGYLKGTGTAWLDDMRYETLPGGTAAPAKRVITYLSKVIDLVKKHAIVGDSIPWDQTKTEMMALAAGMKTEQEAHAVVGYLLDVMRQHGDNHSHFQRPVAVKNLYASAPAEEGPKPEGRCLDAAIGYVSVPGFWGINQAREAAFSGAIQRLIQAIDSAHSVTGWVVDLRTNEGGNMWPMIAGLRPLIGEGTLGYFAGGKQYTPWTYGYDRPKKGGLGAVAPYRLRNGAARVAVLIGPKTASSGEMTAISFIGRPNTRLFGTKSGGFTTANRSFTLPDGAELYLAVSVSADRTGKQYPHGIVPDEEIDAQPNDPADPALAAAKAWTVGK